MDTHEQWLMDRIRAFRKENGVWLRPFLPNPAWRTARVFILGKNAGTEFPGDAFDGSFETYWRALTERPDWFWPVYLQARKGRRFPTSRNEWTLVHRLAPLNVLVTNVYAYSTQFGVPVPLAERHDDEFRRLVSICRPDLVILHGKEAIDHAKQYLEPQGTLDHRLLSPVRGWLPLDPADWSSSRVNRHPCWLLPIPHLSRMGWTGAQVDDSLADLARATHEALGIQGVNAAQYRQKFDHPCDHLKTGRP